MLAVLLRYTDSDYPLWHLQTLLQDDRIHDDSLLFSFSLNLTTYYNCTNVVRNKILIICNHLDRALYRVNANSIKHFVVLIYCVNNKYPIHVCDIKRFKYLSTIRNKKSLLHILLLTRAGRISCLKSSSLHSLYVLFSIYFDLCFICMFYRTLFVLLSFFV